MARYYHQHNLHRQWKAAKRSRHFLLVLAIILLLAGGVMVRDILMSQDKALSPSAPTTPIKDSYTPFSQTFQTEYFSFQASRTWQFVQATSSAHQFFYRSARGQIVEHDLVITVGGPASPEVTRLLPVNRESNGGLNPHPVSDLCQKYLPPNAPKITQPAVVGSVRITCNYDANDYVVIVGAIGEELPLTMTRHDGSTIAFTIIYRNLSGTPDDTEIKRIIESFQAR